VRSNIGRDGGAHPFMREGQPKEKKKGAALLEGEKKNAGGKKRRKKGPGWHMGQTAIPIEKQMDEDKLPSRRRRLQ